MRERRVPGRLTDERVLTYASALLLGFLVVGTVLVVASLVLGGHDDGADRPAAAASPAPSSLPTVATSDSPTAGGSTGTAAPGMTEPAMTDFVRRYLATAGRDPDASWRLLTPGFQRASGGFAAYAGFWGPITDATATGLFADPAARRVTYEVRYRYADGRTSTDSTRLTLVLTDDGFRVAGEG